MGSRGELNVSQLVRQRYGTDCALIGFSTYDGHVTAASNWGEAPQRKRVRPALDGSYEQVLHDVGVEGFWLPTAAPPARAALRDPRLQRAIGVIYRPETERHSHYFRARLVDQFHAIIHLDHTHAVAPLERSAQWDRGEPPETFPTGF